MAVLRAASLLGVLAFAGVFLGSGYWWLVLVMSVFPGFGGQKFIPDVLGKVGALRELGFQGEISMDGGIGPETIAARRRWSSSLTMIEIFISGPK